MTTALVVVAWAVLGTAYSLPTLYTARYIYGKRRAEKIDTRFDYYEQADAIERFNNHDRPWLAMECLVLGLFWPLMWALFVPIWVLIRVCRFLIRFMERTPKRSTLELELDRNVKRFEEITKEQ